MTLSFVVLLRHWKLQNGNSQDKITLESTTGHVTMAGNLTTSGTGAFTDAVTMGSTLGVTGMITGNLTGDVTGTATNANNIDVNNTNNNTFYPTFSASNTGHTGMFVDSANLTYNPFSNTLSVTNFVSTTNFEVQGNLTITGNITYGQAQVGSIANHTTNALAEGSNNLYFTDERVDDRVAALIVGGTGITATYDDNGNMLTFMLLRQTSISTTSQKDLPISSPLLLEPDHTSHMELVLHIVLELYQSLSQILTLIISLRVQQISSIPMLGLIPS